MENEKIRLLKGEIYWDYVHKEEVEFGYMGKTGLAIVYEPGDSGGGMQSSWGVNPGNLESITDNCVNQIKSKKP